MRPMINCVVVFAWAVAGATWGQGPDPVGEAYAAGDLARAQALSDKAPPSLDAKARLIRCRLLLMANRLDKAQACFRSETVLAPDSKPAWSGLADSLARGDQFAAAADAYAKAGRSARAALAAALASEPAYLTPRPRRVYVAGFVQRDALPVLMVRINGGPPRRFILDTGAAETIIDTRLAALAGARTVGTTTGLYAGGKTASSGLATIASLEIGDLTLKHLPVQVLDTSGFAEAVGGGPVDGVIGVDLLRRFVATIDYPGRKLVLQTLETAAAPTGPSAPFWIGADHLLLAEGSINGVPELSLVDTGLAGQGCTAPKSTLDAAGVRPAGPAVSGQGGGGETSAVVFVAKRITLGPISAGNVPCLYGPFPPPLETSVGPRIGLLVSHSFLTPYAVTFDFRAMRVTLR